MKTNEAVLNDLNAKIPRDVISEREGGGGRTLSYLEGHYVIDRLNQLFGPNNWNANILEARLLGTQKPSYLLHLRLTVTFPDGSIKISEALGYGSDKGSNNPHELAIKEARTDALKVAAKDLGMSLGLALYSKDQENVDDSVKGAPSKPPVEKQEPAAPAPKSEAAPAKRDIVNKSVQEYVRVIIDKKLRTKEDITRLLKEKYAVERSAQLSDPQANAFLTELKGILQ